ncbi:MAG: rhodanese-like domain-containing protein [Bernardetiaceae bacterium]
MLNFFKKLFGGSQPTYENLSPEAFKERLKKGAARVVLLDVRTAGEVAGGKIRGARNLDIMRPDFKERIETLDKSKEYLVYCRSGRRSAKACRILTKAGYQAANLKGGYMAWED